MVSGLFCFLCFTSSVSLTSFYTEDEPENCMSHWNNTLLTLSNVLTAYFSQMNTRLSDGPLSLRGRVINASYKQWVGIFLMSKIDIGHKNYLTPKIWEEAHLGAIFYGTLISHQISMICIGLHVAGHTVALQHGRQNYFLLVSY